MAGLNNFGMIGRGPHPIHMGRCNFLWIYLLDMDGARMLRNLSENERSPSIFGEMT